MDPQSQRWQGRLYRHATTAERRAGPESSECGPQPNTTAGYQDSRPGGIRRGACAAAFGFSLAAAVVLFAPAQGTTAGEYLSGTPVAGDYLAAPTAHTGPGITPHEPGEGGCSCPACCGMEIDGIAISSSKAPGGVDPEEAGEYVPARQ